MGGSEDGDNPPSLGGASKINDSISLEYNQIMAENPRRQSNATRCKPRPSLGEGSIGQAYWELMHGKDGDAVNSPLHMRSSSRFDSPRSPHCPTEDQAPYVDKPSPQLLPLTLQSPATFPTPNPPVESTPVAEDEEFEVATPSNLFSRGQDDDDLYPDPQRESGAAEEHPAPTAERDRSVSESGESTEDTPPPLSVLPLKGEHQGSQGEHHSETESEEGTDEPPQPLPVHYTQPATEEPRMGSVGDAAPRSRSSSKAASQNPSAGSPSDLPLAKDDSRDIAGPEVHPRMFRKGDLTFTAHVPQQQQPRRVYDDVHIPPRPKRRRTFGPTQFLTGFGLAIGIIFIVIVVEVDAWKSCTAFAVCGFTLFAISGTVWLREWYSEFAADEAWAQEIRNSRRAIVAEQYELRKLKKTEEQ